MALTLFNCSFQDMELIAGDQLNSKQFQAFPDLNYNEVLISSVDFPCLSSYKCTIKSSEYSTFYQDSQILVQDIEIHLGLLDSETMPFKAKYMPRDEKKMGSVVGMNSEFVRSKSLWSDKQVSFYEALSINWENEVEFLKEVDEEVNQINGLVKNAALTLPQEMDFQLTNQIYCFDNAVDFADEQDYFFGVSP